MGYQPALDGLRAVAVIAVIGYHAGFDWLRGGFFGVEVFFVVSGFLITALLLDERDRSGRTSVGRFWLRRARRLLPALFTVLGAVAVWAAVAGTDEQVSQLRRDLPWALSYGGNWGQIVGGVPYYSGDPPLLRHVWSLAVEEQWYVLWPLAFVALATALSRMAAAKLLAGVTVTVMVVTLWLHRGAPRPLRAPVGLFDGVDRINFLYLSTFTRSSGLLLGAAAAFVWRPWRARRRPDRAGAQPLLDAVGGAAVAALGCIVTVAVLTEGYVYQWLLAVVSMLSLLAVLAAVHPDAVWFRLLLSWRLLVEIGKRSYGLYLWHWPVFVVAGAYHGSVARAAGALAVTAVLSELCYRFVETPVRHGALGRWWATAGERRLVPSLSIAVGAIGLLTYYSSVEQFDRAAGGDDVVFGRGTVAPTVAPTTAATATPTAAAPSTNAAVAPRRVVVVGDSQAHALARNLPEGIGDTFTITDGSVEGCSVYDEGRLRSNRIDLNIELGRCDGWQDDWARSVTDADAEIALVVLGAWDVFDVELDGKLLPFGSPEWNSFVAAGLQSGIDTLAGAGAHVALLEAPCMRPQQVRGANAPVFPERGDDARIAHINDLWRWVASQNPQTVTFVEGPDEWCDDDTISTDLGYRWDGVHVYKPGANLIYETIAPTLLDL